MLCQELSMTPRKKPSSVFQRDQVVSNHSKTRKLMRQTSCASHRSGPAFTSAGRKVLVLAAPEDG